MTQIKAMLGLLMVLVSVAVTPATGQHGLNGYTPRFTPPYCRPSYHPVRPVIVAPWGGYRPYWGSYHPFNTQTNFAVNAAIINQRNLTNQIRLDRPLVRGPAGGFLPNGADRPIRTAPPKAKPKAMPIPADVMKRKPIILTDKDGESAIGIIEAVSGKAFSFIIDGQRRLFRMNVLDDDEQKRMLDHYQRNQ